MRPVFTQAAREKDQACNAAGQPYGVGVDGVMKCPEMVEKLAIHLHAGFEIDYITGRLNETKRNYCICDVTVLCYIGDRFDFSTLSSHSLIHIYVQCLGESIRDPHFYAAIGWSFS